MNFFFQMLPVSRAENTLTVSSAEDPIPTKKEKRYPGYEIKLASFEIWIVLSTHSLPLLLGSL